MGYFNIIKFGKWEGISKRDWKGLVRVVGRKLDECDNLEIMRRMVLIRIVLDVIDRLSKMRIEKGILNLITWKLLVILKSGVWG